MAMTYRQDPGPLGGISVPYWLLYMVTGVQLFKTMTC